MAEAQETHISLRGHPWLAAGLSWLLPGAGHLYAGVYVRGIGFFSLFCLVGGLSIGLLISGYLRDGLALVLSILMPLVARAAASADAFRTTRRFYSSSSEPTREPTSRTYLAVFLSTLVPGLGQLHQRRWRSGVGFLSLYLWLVSVSSTGLIVKGGILVLRMLVCAHAFLVGTGKGDKLAWRAAWLLGGLVGAALLGNYAQQLIRRGFLLETVLWSGDTMWPTLGTDSSCVMDKITYRYHAPEIGDVVVFTWPEPAPVKGKERPRRLSRIVARGGETVEVRYGIILINGGHREPAPRRRHVGWDGDWARREASRFPYAVAQPYRVPEGCYFVVGDNRDTDADSRSYGPIPRENIIGRVTRVYSWPQWAR